MSKVENINCFGGNWQPEEVQLIDDSREMAVSPSLPGHLYEITRVNLEGYNFAVKTLLPRAINRYPNANNLAEVFQEHQLDHERFMKHLGDFVLDTCFYISGDVNGNPSYKLVQRWINFGVQYKEAILNSRPVLEDQLPPVENRMEFIKRITSLLQDSKGQIVDLDFFLEPDDGKYNIVIADTNYFWYPKLPGDKRCMYHNLTTFLFPQGIPQEAKEVVLALQNILDIEQLD